jgi:hypothetical protein
MKRDLGYIPVSDNGIGMDGETIEEYEGTKTCEPPPSCRGRMVEDWRMGGREHPMQKIDGVTFLYRGARPRK